MSKSVGECLKSIAICFLISLVLVSWPTIITFSKASAISAIPTTHQRNNYILPINGEKCFVNSLSCLLDKSILV